MRIWENYELWQSFDEKTKAELEIIRENHAEIEERFYKNLAFGTGGMRGIMGAGTNRINQYTIARATKGFCHYLQDHYGEEAEERGIVIAYDNRNRSQEFAKVAANVISFLGIKTYLFDTLTTTPTLSFAVRHLKAVGGIMITASHNPKEYNGYKAYDEYGCQLVPKDADKVINFVNDIKDFTTIPMMGNPAHIKMIGKDILDAHIENALKNSINKDEKTLKIVYTPLHGTGNKPVRQILEQDGFHEVFIVKEQELPDGDFTTVKSPNPEEKSALAMGIALAKEKKADLVLATDPDSDRIGIAVLDNKEYHLLTGNQVGALLVDYILSNKKNLGENPAIVKTIVTNELGADIAKAKGLKVFNTLTGFKFIGEIMTAFEKENNYQFIFGYEESYGYLTGTYARDKDAVVAAMLISEMADAYKKEKMTLVEKLQGLYNIYGYYADALSSFTLLGMEGIKKIEAIMETLRNQGREKIPHVAEVLDYAKGVANFPKSDVLKYIFKDGSWLAVRPSGTEPKLKIYYSIKGQNKEDATKHLEKLQNTVETLLQIKER